MIREREGELTAVELALKRATKKPPAIKPLTDRPAQDKGQDQALSPWGKKAHHRTLSPAGEEALWQQAYILWKYGNRASGDQRIRFMAPPGASIAEIIKTRQ